MQIEVIGVAVENKGKYRVANVTYKSNGKVDAKNVMSFVFKDVFTTLSEAKQGDVFEVTAQKNNKGYWDWTEVKAGGKNTAGSAEAAGPRGPVRSTYETPEERAKRQVYIVRQSSVTAAIALAELNKVKAPLTEADVITSAKKFEEYVFDIEPAVKPAEVS
jgi:hypothetical protein